MDMTKIEEWFLLSMFHIQMNICQDFFVHFHILKVSAKTPHSKEWNDIEGCFRHTRRFER